MRRLLRFLHIFIAVLLEKNEILGRKIMATGGGRCNITNTACVHCDLTLDFFKSLGMELYQRCRRTVLSIFQSRFDDVSTGAGRSCFGKRHRSGAGLRCDEDPEKGGSFSDLQRRNDPFLQKKGDPGSRRQGCSGAGDYWRRIWSGTQYGS